MIDTDRMEIVSLKLARYEPPPFIRKAHSYAQHYAEAAVSSRVCNNSVMPFYRTYEVWLVEKLHTDGYDTTRIINDIGTVNGDKYINS